MTLVSIDNLRVSFAGHSGRIDAVRGVSFSVREGESLGIVGESGSGKSVTAMALMRLLPPTAEISGTRLELDGTDMLTADRKTQASLRGRAAAMVFQDPATAFDPVFTIGQQIVETIRTHRRVTKAEAYKEAEELLRRVEIKNARDVLGFYPHQLSGGMLQRAMIAMALSCRPKLLIADEPTTALDVTIQAQILALIKNLQAEFGMALIMITHDLGVVAETVDRVVVMYNGEVMEEGPVGQIFDAPAHPYTRTLLASLAAGALRDRPETGVTTPALELRDLKKTFTIRKPGGLLPRYEPFRAVRGIDLTLGANRIVGLVGESGSGKSTTGMMALKLLEASGGDILVEGQSIARLGPAELKPHRRRLQVVFQDSYSALDPMMTLGEVIAEPLDIHGIGTRPDQIAKAAHWLERVGLPKNFINRYPHELSGGQRQRVAIARALIIEPKILVADEPTSALDVTVKAQIISLLKSLQAEMGLSMLFISHDLSVVRSLTDTVLVMWKGRVVEEAPTARLFAEPQHPYTRALIDAIPVTNPRDRRLRRFQRAEELEAQTPHIPASRAGFPAGPEPRLVDLGGGHRVEALVTV